MRFAWVVSLLCHAGFAIAAAFYVVGAAHDNRPRAEFTVVLDERPDVPVEAPEEREPVREPPVAELEAAEVPELPEEETPFRVEAFEIVRRRVELADQRPLRDADWLERVRERRQTQKPIVVAMPKKTEQRPRVSAPPPRPAVEAIPGRNPSPNYPRRARRLGLFGEVILRVEVNAKGEVVGIKVHASSRHRILDAAAERAVRKWRFKNGPGETDVVIRFELEKARGE